MRKIKIIFISIGRVTNLYGAGSMLLELLGLLNKRDFEVTAVVSGEIASLIPPRIQTIVIPGRRNIIGTLKGFLHLYFVLSRVRPDIVHFNFPPVLWHWLPLIFFLKISRSKVVYSFHGGLLIEKRENSVQSREDAHQRQLPCIKVQLLVASAGI